jgi:hypothetical protein
MNSTVVNRLKVVGYAVLMCIMVVPMLTIWMLITIGDLISHVFPYGNALYSHYIVLPAMGKPRTRLPFSQVWDEAKDDYRARQFETLHRLNMRQWHKPNAWREFRISWIREWLEENVKARGPHAAH